MDTPTSLTQRPRQFLAGMPQLGFSGLSENWLLKECGDIHWMHLARAHALAQPDFVEQHAGTRAYAAFTRVRLTACQLDRLHENDSFHIASGLTPAGRSQYVSTHECRLAHAGTPALAKVDMLSAFVHRQEAGSNLSVARALLRATEHWLPDAHSPAPDSAAAFANEARERRQRAAHGKVDVSAGRLDVENAATAPETSAASKRSGAPQKSRFVWRDRPHPELDFNGAGFLYFASFAALIDRAEWHALHLETSLTLISRDLFFYGNVDVGDTLAIHGLDCVQDAQGSLRHHCAVVRETDQRLIAEAITHKRLPHPGLRP